MYLIMSAAFVGRELRSEFGRLPPSFLPLGNRRLFQHQVKLAPSGRQIYLTVPDSFVVPQRDRDWLVANQVTLIKIPDDLELGESLVAALNLLEGSLEQTVSILFGDTLFKSLPLGDDVVSVSTVNDGYDWSVMGEEDISWPPASEQNRPQEKNQIICGYFSLSQPRTLIRSLIKVQWDFIAGLNLYYQDVGLKAVPADDWFDFGHVNTYYCSKVAFTTQREFNDLQVTPRYIEKSSANTKKIAAEAHWYKNIPDMMCSYTPQYLGETMNEGVSAYRLSYLRNTTLNELFVFSELSSVVWLKILDRCFTFLDECKKYTAPKSENLRPLKAFFQDKTAYRLMPWLDEKRVNLDAQWRYNDADLVTIRDILQLSDECLPTENPAQTLVHGDFCFSNILYDFRIDHIKAIDPRGLSSAGDISIYGDIRYDIAKLSHSLLGGYDWIVAGYHSTTVDWLNNAIQFELMSVDKAQSTEAVFLHQASSRYGLSQQNLLAMQIHLFLSMLPLHSDNTHRQDALFANAFRLYTQLKALVS